MSKITNEIKDQVIKLAKNNVKLAKQYLSGVLKTKKTQTNKYFREIMSNGFNGLKVNENNNFSNLEIKNTEINNLDDVLKYAKVDLKKWEVDKFSVSKETKQIVLNGEKKYVPRFDFRISLKRKEVDINELINELKNDLKKYSPIVEKINYNKDKTGLLLEIAAFDLHFGKLGYQPSDGQDYDIKIAESRFKESIVELINKSVKFGNIQEILFPIGNDFLTVDNDNNTTTALTPQSVDSRFAKTYKKGRELLVWAINYLKQYAPVKILCIPGNHEINSMFHIADALECLYKNDNNIIIDNSPFPRKYYKFYNNLIIYDHGDKIKSEKLAIICSNEIKEWSQCKNREIHLGHWHHEKVIDEGSCIVRIIPALTGNDYYHNSNGFVGAKQRAQAFLWHPQNGLNCILYSTSYN